MAELAADATKAGEVEERFNALADEFMNVLCMYTLISIQRVNSRDKSFFLILSTHPFLTGKVMFGEVPRLCEQRGKFGDTEFVAQRNQFRQKGGFSGGLGVDGQLGDHLLEGDGSGLEIFDQSVRTRDRLVRLAEECRSSIFSIKSRWSAPSRRSRPR